MFPNDTTDPKDRVNLTAIGQMLAEIPPEDRIRKGLEILPEFLECWQEDRPEWRLVALIWILDGALKALRQYIESRDESGITWESPYVELHFPVECTWEESDSEHPSFSMTAGRLEKNDMEDAETAIQALAKVIVSYLEIMALQELTNGRAMEKQGDGFRPLLDEASIAQLENIECPKERDIDLQRLFRPLSFGAGHIEYGDMKEGDPVGEDVAAQLAAILPPLVQIPFDANGRKMQVITILEVSHLIADPETKTAYFPIVVGLAVQFVEYPDEPQDATTLLESAGLHNWPEDQRNGLWEILADAVKMSLSEFDSEFEEDMVEAVVEVNARIKFSVPRDDRGSLNRAYRNLATSLGCGGELLSLKMQHCEKTLPSSKDTARIKQLLEDVRDAIGSEAKGKSLEALVEALFASIPSFTVINRVRTESEEIDLWISNHSDQRPFRDESDVILAECKNWTGKCGKNEFVQLYHKMANRGKRCSIGFLISWNGFAETITTEMLRASREPTLIVPLDGEAIRSGIESGDFLQIITDARRQALMV